MALFSKANPDDALPRLVTQQVMGAADMGLGNLFDPQAQYKLVSWKSRQAFEGKGYRAVALVDEENTPGVDYYLMEKS